MSDSHFVRTVVLLNLPVLDQQLHVSFKNVEEESVFKSVYLWWLSCCLLTVWTVVLYKNSWKLICIKTSHIAWNMTDGSNAQLHSLSFCPPVIILCRCTKCRPTRARYEIGMLGWQDMPYISIIRIPRARILAPLSPIIECVVWCRSSPRSMQHQPPLILSPTHTTEHTYWC